MRALLLLDRVLIVLFGVSSGLYKVAFGPADVEIFAHLGFSAVVTALFGAVQVGCALACLPARTRPVGAVGLAACNAVATGALFAAGIAAFGGFSILFVAMALVLVLDRPAPASRTAGGVALAFGVARRIDAAPERVWALLTDGPRWPEWNPTVARVEGSITLGGSIRVFTTADPKRAFPVTVAEMDAPRRMVWRGGMPLGAFQGVRTYELVPHADGTTELRMREAFSGWLASLVTRSIPDLQPAFEAFADGLKQRAEADEARGDRQPDPDPVYMSSGTGRSGRGDRRSSSPTPA